MPNVEFEIEPAFGLSIPEVVPGGPVGAAGSAEFMEGQGRLRQEAADLSQRFAKNFEQFDAPQAVKDAGPKPVAVK